MKFNIIHPVLASAFLAFCHFGQAATILTSFESADGFAVGDTGKTVSGWVLPTNATVTNAQQYDGSNSLAITSASAITTYTLNATQLNANYNSLSFAVMSSTFAANTQIGLWQVLYGGNQTESRIDVTATYGATAIDPIKLTSSSTYTTNPTPTPVTSYLSGVALTDWNVATVSFDFTNLTYRVEFAGQIAANNEMLNTGVTGARIAKVYFRGATGQTSYYDYVTVDHVTIPEPSGLLLMGIGLFVPVCFRRWRHRVCR